MSEFIIEVADVVKRFHPEGGAVTALDGLSLSVRRDRVTGLVGPDGAGKTTLLRVMAGILNPDAGHVRLLGGEGTTGVRPDSAAIGYMPQQFGLYEDLSVVENLELYADLYGLAGARRRDRLDELLAFTGLGPFRRRLAGRLSGGMKQKLALACTLVRPPRVLLLDEPSVGVDPVSRRELWRIVHDLLAQGITVVWSTAYLDEAERCHEVLLLAGGRALASGEPHRLGVGVEDRTFELRPDPARKREALRRLKRRPEVLDAVIKGHDIRLLLAEDAEPPRLREFAQSRGWAFAPTPPQLEDAFIALLKGGSRDAAARKDAPTAPGPPDSAVRKDGGDESRAAAPARRGNENEPPPVIDVRDLTRDFGAFRAVDRVTFAVARGEIFGLLGPNGAGKSTAFKVLLGLLPPSAGSARVLGFDLRKAAAVARGRFGYMAQKFSLYGDLTVLQNLRFYASAYGLRAERAEERIGWALDEFELTPSSGFRSGDLPPGYKQRLSLACAIMHEPGVLFLDEPTSGVDPLVRRSFWDRINAMADAGVTIMVTTHFMDEAEYCDRIGIIYQGRLIATGTPDELKSRSATAETPEPTLEDAFVRLIQTYEEPPAA